MQANFRPLGSRYRLYEEIGRGAMGSVWRGESTTGQPVAVKILLPDLANDPLLVQRFVAERSVLTGVRDANVVEVLDLVVEGDTLGIVMEYVPGANLRTVLSRAGTLAPQQVALVGTSLADGLAAIHARRIVHRDVKPENVLVTQLTPPKLKLTDFGISRLDDESARNRRTVMVGTPFYMAPELGFGAPPTFASDMYALGIMLYELTCGVTPFGGAGAWAIMRAHAESAPPIPPHFPPVLWELVAALLVKDPTQRLSDAAQLSQRLSNLAPGLASLPPMAPLSAPPVAQPSLTPLRSVPNWGPDLAPSTPPTSSNATPIPTRSGTDSSARADSPASKVGGIDWGELAQPAATTVATPAVAANESSGNLSNATIYSPFSVADFVADQTQDQPIDSSVNSLRPHEHPTGPAELPDLASEAPSVSGVGGQNKASEASGAEPSGADLVESTVLVPDVELLAPAASMQRKPPVPEAGNQTVFAGSFAGGPAQTAAPEPATAPPKEQDSTTRPVPVAPVKPRFGRKLLVGAVAAVVLLGSGLVAWHPWSRSTSAADSAANAPKAAVGVPVAYGMVSSIDKEPRRTWQYSTNSWYTDITAQKGGFYPGIVVPALRNAWVQYANYSQKEQLKVHMVDLSSGVVRWTATIDGRGRCGGGPTMNFGCVTSRNVTVKTVINGAHEFKTDRRVGLGVIGSVVLDAASNVYVASGDGKTHQVRVDKVSFDGSDTWSWHRTGLDLDQVDLQVLGNDLLVKATEQAGIVLRLSDGSTVPNLDQAHNLQSWGDRLLTSTDDAKSELYNLDGLRLGGLIGNRSLDEPNVLKGTASAFDVPQDQVPIVTSWTGNLKTYVYDRSAKLLFSLDNRMILGQCNKQWITAQGGFNGKGESVTIDARSLDNSVAWTYKLNTSLVQIPSLVCDGSHYIIGYRDSSNKPTAMVALDQKTGARVWQASSDVDPLVENIAGRGASIIGFGTQRSHVGKPNETDWLIVRGYH